MKPEKALLAAAIGHGIEGWMEGKSTFYRVFTEAELTRMANGWTMRIHKRKDGSLRVAVTKKIPSPSW